MPEPLLPSDPLVLGRYRLVGRLSRGGMGTVYLGQDPRTDRRVAIKVILPEFAHQAEFRARFRSEVNRAREVPAFCTAAVLDADPDGPTPYLVVEYVDGPPLNQVVREQGPFAGSALVNVAVGVATALAAIHGAGVIHRDLKPGNVLFARGGVKVIDFGISRAADLTSAHTRTDQMVGTVAYMAPERFETAKGAAADPAADIFAWGVLVAYAATGRTPFEADSPTATAVRIMTQPPDLTGLDGVLRDLVEQALDKDPRHRPTAAELLNALVGGQPVAARVRPPAPKDKPRLLGRRLLLAGGVGAAAAAALGVWVARDDQDTGRAATDDPDNLAGAARFVKKELPEVIIQASPVLYSSNKVALWAVEAGKYLSVPKEGAPTLVGVRDTYESIRLLAGDANDHGTYLIVRYVTGKDDPESMIAVKPGSGSTATLTVDSFGALSEKMIFRLSPSGGTDEGQLTYWLSNDDYGYVYWDGKGFQVTGEKNPRATTTFRLQPLE